MNDTTARYMLSVLQNIVSRDPSPTMLSDLRTWAETAEHIGNLTRLRAAAPAAPAEASPGARSGAAPLRSAEQ